MDLWAMIHAERAALAEDLAALDDAQWDARSLCYAWTVREVVAHMSAAASVGRGRVSATVDWATPGRAPRAGCQF